MHWLGKLSTAHQTVGYRCMWFGSTVEASALGSACCLLLLVKLACRHMCHWCLHNAALWIVQALCNFNHKCNHIISLVHVFRYFSPHLAMICSPPNPWSAFVINNKRELIPSSYCNNLTVIKWCYLLRLRLHRIVIEKVCDLTNSNTR